MSDLSLVPHLADPARLDAIVHAGLGAEGRDATFQRLSTLSAHLVGTSSALATVVQPDDLLIKGARGLTVPPQLRVRMPVEYSLCQFVVAQDAPLRVPDVRADPLGQHLPAVMRPLVGAYLGVPFRAPNEQPLGAICVVSREPRDWSAQDLARLTDLSVVATNELRTRRERGRREALRSVGGAAFTADTDGRITWIGEQWTAQTGQALSDALGTGWLQVVHPDDRAAVARAWREAVARRRPFVEECRVVPVRGETRRIALRATPSSENGLVVIYVGAWADIEPERQAEEAAARAEAMIEGVFAAAPLAMGVVEVVPGALVSVRCNPAAVALAGDAGRPLWKAGAGSVAGGEPSQEAPSKKAVSRGEQQWLEACHRVVRHGHPITFEYALRHPGRRRVLSVRLTPAGTAESGRPLCAYFAEDVTDDQHQQRRLAQSEERLQLALDSAEMGTWTWDLRQGTLEWSAQMLALCRLDAFDGTVGAALSAIYQPDRGRYLRVMSEAVERARRHVANADLKLEFRIAHRSSLRWIRMSGRVYVDEAGGAVRMAGVATDVTEEVITAKALVQASDSAQEAAEQAREAQAKAEEAARLKASILNNMSHEIRTPLTTVIGYADLLAEESTGTDRELVAAIDRGAKRLLTTLNSVLDLARLESGVTVRKTRLDVGQEAREAVELFEEQARQKGLLLILDAPTGAAFAIADKGALQRTLANLLSNAVKFTREGSVSVSVRHDEQAVTLEISDTGVGMSPGFIEEAFEPFRQESEGVGRMHEGTGIGLAIVRQLVALMDGRVEVESVQGGGTTFRCILPAATAADPDSMVARDVVEAAHTEADPSQALSHTTISS